MEGHARCRHSWEFKAVRRIEILAVLWDCGRCHSSRVTKLNVPPELTEATLSVSLSAFLALLDEARHFDARYPLLNQTGWLTSDTWAFSDESARYRSARMKELKGKS
jgi:hypothetical protein